MTKKAQITFFIFFGFTLFLAVGILLAIIANKSEKRVEQETMTKPKVSLRAQPVKDAINTCLKLIATQALITIGKQGGFLYQNQGGSADDIGPADLGRLYVEYDQQKTRYLIDEPQGTIEQFFFTQQPHYPWDIFPYTDNSYASTLFKGYYGINKLPALYRPAQNSLQEQIETYVANNEKKCFNTNAYPGLDITTESANATFYIANETAQLSTEQAVHFTLHWPVTINEHGSNTTTTLTEFGTTIPLPFATIYYTITSMIDNDVTNISYEPHTEGTYTVTINDLGKDSLINAQFPATLLDNKPYEFRFARHSRTPALHLIKDLKNTLQTDAGEIHDTIQLPVGATISITANHLLFSNYACSRSTTSGAWNIPVINLNASDPDGILNNNKLLFKLNPEQPKFEHPTGNNRPTELQLIVQKQNDPTKKDSQTFYVSLYCCPDNPCQ